MTCGQSQKDGKSRKILPSSILLENFGGLRVRESRRQTHSVLVNAHQSCMKEQMLEILTLEQVADYLKVTPRTVYSLVREGKLPAFKLGGVWRFRWSELQSWIDTALESRTPPLSK